jgi:hypothetical protein
VNQGTIVGAQRNILSFPKDTDHTISVDEYVEGPTGVRYHCAQNSWSFGSAGKHTFNYQTQYELAVNTDPNGVFPTTSEWYDPGSIGKTTAAPETLQGQISGVKYVFDYWEVDGVNRAGNSTVVAMNGPHSAIAKYTVQYLLTVLSPNRIGNPQGSGYYDAGTVANFSVSTPVGFLVQQIFAEWTGNVTGTSPQASIVMTGPVVVHAVWITSYIELFVLTGIIFAIAVGLVVRRSRETRGLPIAT